MLGLARLFLESETNGIPVEDCNLMTTLSKFRHPVKYFWGIHDFVRGICGVLLGKLLLCNMTYSLKLNFKGHEYLCQIGGNHVVRLHLWWSMIVWNYCIMNQSRMMCIPDRHCHTNAMHLPMTKVLEVLLYLGLYYQHVLGHSVPPVSSCRIRPNSFYCRDLG
ncbi:hypothetical protein V8B97DRAFT_347053 [Scleroderma yunnanense]